ncbi:response regulator transcription factor [Hespellia stercorisuis]|uniref:Stage 0 sporulation protein A homolog n=1 Tax=Hespellia stercorisuis DSM 15480 TaxID=1121950 RepID=A0A1M6MGL6_9FIRM|nr:response regulator transcription factor [Hespellia stercorisuis]SHJ82605.1 DNA-binding response regulator, OmpR family, contains REC and winged-helix (wHTH) domain [Hespellia stercorisuis DSM 15480]
MRILMIEDEKSLADIVAERLRREEYTVDVEYTGTSGYEQALTGIYDAVILDVMLPGMDGFTVLQNLRKEKVTTPVLMLTARAEVDDKVNGLDLGADDYLTKPFEMRELLARMRALCRRRGETDISVLSFGDVTMRINRPEFMCTVTGESMKLGRKEYLLMEYFMRNSSQIISREQITEKIWGYESEAEYNNVEVYVSFLRKKVKAIGSRVQIRAVRGMGYHLEESHD